MVAEAHSSKPMSIILTLVLGVLGGLLDESVFGFCSGAILGFLVAQVLSLRQRVRALDQQFGLLKAARVQRGFAQPPVAEKATLPIVEPEYAPAAVEPATPAVAAEPVKPPGEE